MTKAEGKMGPSMSAVFTRYELYARAAGFSPAHVDNMRNSVSYFDQFLGGIKDPAAVTADDFRRYLAYLPNKPVWKGLKNEQTRLLSGTSINTYAREVQTFFKWMAEEGIIPADPIDVVRIPKKPKTLPKIYSEQDLIAVIRAAETNLRDNAVFSLFIDSGIRLAELAGIKMGNLDIPGGWVRVMGKGHKERIVPFDADASHCLAVYIEAERRKNAGKDEPLFLTEDGHPLSKRGVQSLMVRLGEKAGIKERLAPHKLRHSFATYGAKWGANLEELRIILGHADVSTTSGSYLNVQKADLKNAHTRFSPLAHLKQIAAGEHSDVPDKNRQAAPGEVKPPPETAQVPEGSISIEQESRQASTDRKQIRPGTVEANVTPFADTVRLGLYQRLYDEHSRKLTALVRSLIEDIRKSNVETETKTKAKPGMFGNWRAVYPSQKLDLWPSLQQHLDSEFKNPPLSEQINQVALSMLLASFSKNKSSERALADAALEKLVVLSERGTFVGRCKVCEGYFLIDRG